MPPPLRQRLWGPRPGLWVQAGFALQGGRPAGQKKWNPSRNVESQADKASSMCWEGFSRYGSIGQLSLKGDVT